MEDIKYGKWKISYDPKPIPDRRWDYDAIHEEYDGENGLAFSGYSVDAVKTEIDEYFQEGQNG